MTSISSHHQTSHIHSAYLPSHNRGSASSKRPVRPAFKREKSGSCKQKRVSIEDPEPTTSFNDEDDMAASFPQFCTMCENQIITPSSTILYCSDRCRRRDMNKPLSSSVPSSHGHLHSRPMTPTQAYQALDFRSPPRDIIPQRSPTAIQPNRFSFTDLSSAASSDIEDEEDTNEDVLRRPRGPMQHRRQDSEAARYLRQFQSPAFVAESSSRFARRPKPQSRASTISLAPSLTHSPSPGTSPSSLTPLSSMPLTYSRPLPSRANPYSSSFGAKSINLVTPLAGAQSLPQSKSTISLPGLKAQASVATNVGADDLPNEMPAEELKYEKKTMVGSPQPEVATGALRSLFRFDEMQAPPSAFQ
ncbi:hypothetical protein BT63DRAFT_41657 [Microthyrium microscopicum]|uniref:Life-span regulatory factor-domain-containing protein n=1 Tax=Microthyrium microscopicum TaxID=703497 RepID=A0A6A6UX40_9PEZI|nr:hypothetical protein BT63DRAFT_41657 [Microthyrium microscopicum]